MSKSKVSITAAKVISDIIYETLKKCQNVEQRRALITLNDEIIKSRHQDETMGYEQQEIMINCFEREREALKQKIAEEG